MSVSIMWSWVVTPTLTNDNGKRADKLITEALGQHLGRVSTPSRVFPALTRSGLQKLISDGRVTVDGIAIRSNTTLRPGQEIRLLIPAAEPLDLIPAQGRVEILYEDSDVLVINKPAGLPVHPSPTHHCVTLVHILLHQIKTLSGIGGKLRPGIVHRLDKDTTGALLVTKNDLAHQKFSELFSCHEIHRTYWAICFGTPQKRSGTIRGLIGRSVSDRKKMSSKPKTGRMAVTHFRVLEEFRLGPHRPAFASLIEAKLETGRTHQVRVHLTALGHSLLGDQAYGVASAKQAKWLALPPDVKEIAKRLPGQALHAASLEFTHPILNKPIHVQAHCPPVFEELLSALRKFK